jgi:hypothetical protein
MAKVLDDVKKTNVIGSIDVLRNGYVAGWAFDQDNPTEPLLIEVWLDNGLVCSARADEFRQDLTKLGNGEGRYAFRMAIVDISPDQYTNLVVNAKPIGGEAVTTLLPSARALGEDPLTIDLRKLLPATNELKAQLRVIARAQEKVISSIESVGVRRNGPNADFGPGSLVKIETMLEALLSTQSDLQEHTRCTEIFLMRFDKILSELDTRVTKLSEPKGLILLRWTLGLSVTVITILAFGLLASVYRGWFIVR